ncbi:protein of unknown function [Ruminococcaceae bacterium BL-4]|nr:protein of unknown function [Ruminococcaceae bacterium BL-4]
MFLGGIFACIIFYLNLSRLEQIRIILCHCEITVKYLIKKETPP